MKKADNFDASKWLVENKITFQSRLNENKIPGVDVEVDDDMITLSGDSGDYDGFIEDDGTVSFSVVYEDEDDRDGMEFDEDNWKSILGDDHVFVKIAKAIPTKVEALDDYVMITVKADDLTSMNESKVKLNEDLTSQIAALPDFETSPDTEEATLIVGNYAVVHYDQTDEGGEDMYVVWDNTRDQEEIGSYDDEPEFESADPAEVAAFLKSKNNNVDESYYATLGGSSPLSDVAMKTKIVEPALGPNFETVKMFKDSNLNPRYKQLEAKFPREIIDKWKLLYRSDSYQGYAKLSPDGKVIKATILDDGGISGVFYVKSGDGIK
jgi:hypothetical protein